MAALYLRSTIYGPNVAPSRTKCNHEVAALVLASQLGVKIASIRRYRYVWQPELISSSSSPVAAAAAGVSGNTNSSQGKAADQSPGGRVGYYQTCQEAKAALYQALEGINRGIFGITSAKKSEVEGLVELLESWNPTSQPTDHLSKVDGCWKLIYCTISILGVKRTRLGLRDFINLGDFFQIIDVAKDKAVNVIKFNARGFKMLAGQLRIEASFKIASKTRVDIKLEDSSITPDELMNLFQKNYGLLLSIFNPEGWLDISYVDDSMRIGRDDKGNIFVLERTEHQEV